MVITFIPGGIGSEMTGTPGKGVVAKVAADDISVPTRCATTARQMLQQQMPQRRREWRRCCCPFSRSAPPSS